MRGIILQAAFDELVLTGIDRFNFDRVSARAACWPAPINADVLFTDSPIGAAYVEQALEIFLRGITRPS